MQYEISMTDCLHRQYSKSKKSTKMAAIKELQVRITKYLMYIYEGHRCICVPNMNLPCLILWQGELCTDEDNDAGRRGTTDKAGLYKALWLINQMSQKVY